MRVGYHASTRPLDKSQPWLWLVDRTVQIGAVKLRVILGCPMSAVPFGERALQLADLQLVALVPMEHSPGAAVEIELENAAHRTGVPRLIVSDRGSDLTKGIADYCEYRPGVAPVPDIAHSGANLLEQAWAEPPRWQPFVRQLQDTSSQLRQTPSAYLLAPKLRAKARSMNVATQLQFAERVAQHLARASPRTKAVEHYGWLREFREDLALWTREHHRVQTTLAHLRVQGLHRGTLAELESAWGAIGVRASTVRIANRLRAYATKYRPSPAAERFVASTEILESSFGKLKRIEGPQSQDGRTALSLAMGAIGGDRSDEAVRVAMDNAPQKVVDRWFERVWGHSVQWLRQQFQREIKAQQNRDEGHPDSRPTSDQARGIPLG